MNRGNEEFLIRRIDRLQAQVDSLVILLNASLNLDTSLRTEESAPLRSALAPKNRPDAAKAIFDKVKEIVTPKKTSKFDTLIEKMGQRMDSFEKWHQQQLAGAPAFGVPPAVTADMQQAFNNGQMNGPPMNGAMMGQNASMTGLGNEIQARIAAAQQLLTAQSGSSELFQGHLAGTVPPQAKLENFFFFIPLVFKTAIRRPSTWEKLEFVYRKRV